MRIIGVTNQKGGVGKTTTSLALGAALAHSGKRILFIDLDPQGNMSATLNADQENGSAFEVLSGAIPMEKAIRKTALGGCLCSSPFLAGADRFLNKTGKEYILREALSKMAVQYDYTIIDTPPALGVLTVNALTACNDIIIPSQADVYSLQGISQIYETIEAVKKYCNPQLAVAGILIVRFNPRIILNRDISAIMEQTAVQMGTKVFNTRIRESVAIREAQARKLDLFSYEPESNGALDYIAFIREYEGGLNG